MSGPPQIRVHRIAYSTNVERVALAAAHKGVEVTWVDVDPADRGAVRALSGQDLVPVMETGAGEVVADSTTIIGWLERSVPEPALWPRDAAARATADIAVEWFNAVWKVAPNAIEDEIGKPAPDADRIAGWSADMARGLQTFEGLLSDRDFLLGDTLGVLDVCAFPFLKYGLIAPDPGDEERFHHILHDHQRAAADLPALAAWIRRVDALPRA
jgi:glutathione S-transferase